MRRTRGPVREGKVHVQERMCDTCIFRPGNLMNLNEGRVEQMVRDAGDEGHIPCHDTLDGQRAVCRGFFDKHKGSLLQIAERLGYVRYVPVPRKS